MQGGDLTDASRPIKLSSVCGCCVIPHGLVSGQGSRYLNAYTVRHTTENPLNGSKWTSKKNSMNDGDMGESVRTNARLVALSYVADMYPRTSHGISS